MTEFVRQNKKMMTTVSVATIILVIVFNILYYIFAPIQSQGDPVHFVATPIIEQSAQSTAGATPIKPVAQNVVSLATLGILLAIVLLVIVIIFALLMYANSQRRQRDAKRRQDLKRLAQAFEAYHQEHGQYPMSSTYLPQYYTGVNLSNDWNYYGLPNKEHMQRYLPEWPLSDPSLDYQAKQQINQYIYYPKENGQKFFLYAHLEAPSKAEQVDYNQQDNLLRSWGAYNYRVGNGQEQPLAVQPLPHPQHAKPAPVETVATPTPPPSAPATIPASPPPVAPQPVNPAASVPATPNAMPSPSQSPASIPAPPSTPAVTPPAPTPLAAQPAVAVETPPPSAPTHIDPAANPQSPTVAQPSPLTPEPAPASPPPPTLPDPIISAMPPVEPATPEPSQEPSTGNPNENQAA